jgi:hypothetical protein
VICSVLLSTIPVLSILGKGCIQGDRTIGWFQVAQSLESLENIAQELPTEILINLPWFLTLTASGGLFLPHIFERFYRVESARSQTKTGAGLGLAIAHGIVRLHAGTLTAQSEPDHEYSLSRHLTDCF